MSFSAWQIAEACLQAGEVQEALQALEDHLKTSPDDAGRRLHAALLLRLRSDETGLRQALADLAALSSEETDDFVQRSIIHEKLGDVEAAQTQMRRALEDRPNDERLAERLVWLLRQAGRLNEALALIRQQRRTWRWLRWEGDLLAEMGDNTTASARYGLAMAQMEAQFDLSAEAHLAAQHAQIAGARAGAFSRMGLVTAAEECYAIAAQRLKDPVMDFNRGLLRLLSGELDEAEALCRAGLAAASEEVRATMLAELRGNERYTALLLRLGQG